jgi:hypothetical protein
VFEWSVNTVLILTECLLGRNEFEEKKISKCRKRFHFCAQWASSPGIAQSVERLATGWTFRGSNPDGGGIFRTRPYRPWGLPSLLYNGYQVIPGSKAAGAWRLPPTPSTAEVKEKVEPYLYSTYGLSWSVLGWTFKWASSHCCSETRLSVKRIPQHAGKTGFILRSRNYAGLPMYPSIMFLSWNIVSQASERATCVVRKRHPYTDF